MPRKLDGESFFREWPHNIMSHVKIVVTFFLLCQAIPQDIHTVCRRYYFVENSIRRWSFDSPPHWPLGQCGANALAFYFIHFRRIVSRLHDAGCERHCYQRTTIVHFSKIINTYRYRDSNLRPSLWNQLICCVLPQGYDLNLETVTENTIFSNVHTYFF